MPFWLTRKCRVTHVYVLYSNNDLMQFTLYVEININRLFYVLKSLNNAIILATTIANTLVVRTAYSNTPLVVDFLAKYPRLYYSLRSQHVVAESADEAIKLNVLRINASFPPVAPFHRPQSNLLARPLKQKHGDYRDMPVSIIPKS